MGHFLQLCIWYLWAREWSTQTVHGEWWAILFMPLCLHGGPTGQICIIKQPLSKQHFKPQISLLCQPYTHFHESVPAVLRIVPHLSNIWSALGNWLCVIFHFPQTVVLVLGLTDAMTDCLPFRLSSPLRVILIWLSPLASYRSMMSLTH